MKERVGEILHELGLNHSTAINMYYRLIAAQRGIPFEVRLPKNYSMTWEFNARTDSHSELF